MSPPDTFPNRHDPMSTPVHPLELSQLADAPADSAPLGASVNVNPLHAIRTQLQVVVGEASISVGELLAAREHQVLVLDRALNHPVDLVLEGRVVARGELVAVDDHFAVRITELPLPLKA